MPRVSGAIGVTIEEARRWLHSRGLSAMLLAHCEEVGAKSKSIAQGVVDINSEEAELGGLLHDCAKEIKGERQHELAQEFGIKIDPVDVDVPEDLHARLGAFLVRKELGITNPHVLSAIWSHTFGPAGLPELFDKGTIIDVQSGGVYKAVLVGDDTVTTRGSDEIAKIERSLAKKGIDGAVLKALKLKFQKAIDKPKKIHPYLNDSRNYFLSLFPEKMKPKNNK